MLRLTGSPAPRGGRGGGQQPAPPAPSLCSLVEPLHATALPGERTTVRPDQHRKKGGNRRV